MSREGSNGGEHGVLCEDHGEYEMPDGYLPHSLIFQNSQAHKGGTQKWNSSNKGSKQKGTTDQEQNAPKHPKTRNQVNKRANHLKINLKTRTFYTSKASTNKQTTTDALTLGGPNKNQQDTLQLGSDPIRSIDERGTIHIEKDPTECSGSENNDSRTQNPFL